MESVLSTPEILQLSGLRNASFTSVHLSGPLISAELRKKQNSQTESRMLTLLQGVARSGFVRNGKSNSSVLIYRLQQHSSHTASVAVLL